MEKHTVGGLRQALVSESDFHKIQDYFLTLTETNLQAIDGKLGKNKSLKEIIQFILGEVVGVSRPTLVNLMMVEVRQRNFWHGSGFLNGNIFTFFYFADLDKGLITYSKFSGENLLIRLSNKTVMEKPDMPNMNWTFSSIKKALFESLKQGFFYQNTEGPLL